MGKILATLFMTLDGVIENPAWSMPYWNDEIAAFKGEEFEHADAQLLGRITYEGFAQAWPESKDEGAEQFNAMPKHVVSTTLKEAPWNNSHIISENIYEQVAALKDQYENNIVISGSATLIQSLLKEGLIDQLNLLVYPVVIGSGKRLFSEDSKATLKLVDSKTFSGGVVALVYEPAM